MRAAVTGDGTVKQLTELAGQLAQAEQVSGRSWAEAVLPPVLPAANDPWQRAVVDLWAAAHRGDGTGCQAVLPRCVPWEDRDPAKFEQMCADALVRQHKMQELAMQNMLGGRPRGGPDVLQPLPNPLPGALPSARTGW